jgi:hypothetical protein
MHQVSQPGSHKPEKKLHVDAKAWPSFDGTGPLDAFLAKVEYFMHITGMQDYEKKPKLIQQIKGRAFIWLSHHPTWRDIPYADIVALL